MKTLRFAANVLLVLVLQGGTVKQQMLHLEEPWEQEALSRLSNEINERLAGFTRDQIVVHSGSLSSLGQQIGELVSQVMAGIDHSEKGLDGEPPMQFLVLEDRI